MLAAGGRMVQKDGQAALEEPQGSPNPAAVPGAPLEPPGAAAAAAAAVGPVQGGEETDTETETALGSRRFLCGVVEGEGRRGCSPPPLLLLLLLPPPPPPRGARVLAAREGFGAGRSRGCRAGRLLLLLLALGRLGLGAARWQGAPSEGRGQAWLGYGARLLLAWCVKEGRRRERGAAVGLSQLCMLFLHARGSHLVSCMGNR